MVEVICTTNAQMAPVIRIIFDLTLPLLLLIFVATSNQQATLTLDQVGRDPDGLSITLRCRRISNLLPFPNAEYWINGTSTPLDRSLYTVETEGEITFFLRPAQEGFFFCGSISQGITSNSLELVAYPEPVDVQTSYIIEVGDPVTLQCPYRPGALIQHYDYTWYVGTTSEPIADADPRYSIGGDLIINATVLSDESQYYKCKVEIYNPRGNDWTQRSDFITLDIYERPSFVQFPAPRVVLENQTTSVVFTCGVRGSPRPEISWKFNEIDVTEHEAAIAARFQDDQIFDDGHIVTRRLTFNQLQRTDSGSIICVARTMEPEVFVVSEKTILSVLTSNFVLETGITDGGDLQVRIILDISIQDELQFRLRYTETGTDEQREQTVEGNFINEQSIFFRVPLAQLPFSGSQFTVQVAMEVNGVLGNFTKPSKLLNTNNPDPLPDEGSNRDDNLLKITIPVSIAGFAIFVVTIAVIVILVLVYKFKSQTEINRIEIQLSEHQIFNGLLQLMKTHPDKTNDYKEMFVEAFTTRTRSDGEDSENDDTPWQYKYSKEYESSLAADGIAGYSDFETTV